VDSLAHTETQTLIEKSVERFVADRCVFARRLISLRAGPADYLSLWPEYVELGLLALPFAEEAGGTGGGLRDVAVAVHALGPGLILEPFIEVAVIAGSLLESLGQPEAELAALMSGEKLIVLADGRPATAGGVKFRATAQGYVLMGRIPVVEFASQAQEWLVVGTCENDGATALFRLQPNCPGVAVHSFQLLDGRPAADIVLQSCELSGSALLAEGESAQTALDFATRRGHVAYCAEALGIMKRLVDMTGAYLSSRVQFGVPIASFQALQHRFADLYMSYRESFAVVSHCIAEAHETGTGYQQRALLAARVVMAEAARLIGHESIQMHGGIGATQELPVSHLNNRLVVIRRALLGRERTQEKLAVFAGAVQ
jgi:alkylation response protein AidB-like acyl-CoA dehydrogenase